MEDQVSQILKSIKKRKLEHMHKYGKILKRHWTIFMMIICVTKIMK